MAMLKKSRSQKHKRNVAGSVIVVVASPAVAWVLQVNVKIAA
jgi:hypothetical protein